jgi:Ca2+-binding RTX toxin-like protein
VSDGTTALAGLSPAMINAALAAPKLAAQVVDVSTATKGSYTFSNLHDVVLVQTGDTSLQQLYVTGGKNVSVLGADIRPTSNAVSSALYFKNTAASVTVEGVYIDNGKAGEHDGIGLDGGSYTPDVTIGASMVLNVSGSYAGFHGDAIQSHSGLGKLTVSNFVGTTNYQGIFMGGGAGTTPSALALDNVYLGYASGTNKYPVLLWIGDGTSTIPTTMNKVTLDSQAATRGTDYATIIYDDGHVLTGSKALDTVTYAGPHVSGEVNFGTAASATLPTAAATGIHYDWQSALAKSLGVDHVAWGTGAADTMKAASGTFALFGNAGNDTLAGGNGNDYLDGGLGADAMTGGRGDDVYVVDNSFDAITEWIDGGRGGTDTVLSSISYHLGGNVENLELTGAGAISGWGNDLDNILVGGLGANSLYGNGGNDKLYGAEGADRLDGGAGNDLLNGGTGTDTLLGGTGDDTYVLDDAGDAVSEYVNAGNDTVIASISYTLGNHLENLVLTGSALNGTGNSFDNVIVGNAGDNKLWGGVGNDTLNGGAGADLLYGSAGQDTFVFRSGEAQGDKVMDFEKGDKLSFEGYGVGAYATMSGNQLTIHYPGGEETVTVYGTKPVAGDWSFGSMVSNQAEVARGAVEHAGW